MLNRKINISLFISKYFVNLFFFLFCFSCYVHAQEYCNDHGRVLVVVAHADDDLYFINPKIKNEIARGYCVKVVHITGGYEHKNNYRERIEGSKLAYAQMIGVDFPNWAEYWENINGREVQRFVLINKSGQGIEIQELGIPCSANKSAQSNFGVTLAELYHDATKITKTIDGKNSEYSWKDIQDFINIIFLKARPSLILTTDPYGAYFEDGHEGQHPDHIMAAKLVQKSDITKSKFSKIEYYKTSQINDLQKNLLSKDIYEKNLYLTKYWSKDKVGFGFQLPLNEKDCSGMINSSSKLFSPFSWVCKMYQATANNYFVAEVLQESNTNKCLVLNDKNDFIFTDNCDVANSITLTKNGLAYISTTGKILTGTAKVNFPIRAISYEPNNGFFWKYDGTSKLSYFDPLTGNKYCVDNKNDLAVSELCSNVKETTLTIKPYFSKKSATFDLLNIRLRNMINNNNCLSINEDSIGVSSCESETTRLNVLATGQLQSVLDPSICVETNSFSADSKLIVRKCNSNSAGQIFNLKKVGADNLFVLINEGLNGCIEIQNESLTSLSCHAFKKQLWSIDKFIDLSGI